MEITIEKINENCKIRVIELEKMLADYKIYLAKKYPDIRL